MIPTGGAIAAAVVVLKVFVVVPWDTVESVVEVVKGVDGFIIIIVVIMLLSEGWTVVGIAVVDEEEEDAAAAADTDDIALAPRSSSILSSL
jgi:hypothetical protein